METDYTVNVLAPARMQWCFCSPALISTSNP